MLLLEGRQQRRDHFDAEHFRHRQAQHTGAGLLADTSLHGRYGRRHAADRLEQLQGGRRRLQTFRGAGEQANPQITFQLGDLPADGGLRRHQLPCGGGQAARLQYGEKIAEQVPVGLVIHRFVHSDSALPEVHGVLLTGYLARLSRPRVFGHDRNQQFPVQSRQAGADSRP